MGTRKIGTGRELGSLVVEDNSCVESKVKTKQVAIKYQFWSLALSKLPGWSVEMIKVSN